MESDTQVRTTKFANLLFGVAFFNIFTEKELMGIVEDSKLMTMVDFQRGMKIFNQDEYDRNFFILMRGGVELRRKDGTEEKERCVSTIKKGEVFGEMVITDPTSPRRSSAYVSGGEDVIVARVNAMLVDNSPPVLRVKFLKKFLDLLIDRLPNTEKAPDYFEKIITFAEENGTTQLDEFFVYCTETAISERNKLTQLIKYTDYLVATQLNPENCEEILRGLLEQANQELDETYRIS